MSNLRLYTQCAEVPENAQRTITGGKLNGKTDINAMWRIKKLTEMFGPCGIGWKYVIKDKQLVNAADGEIAAFVDIDLFYKENDQWSDPVPGTGGNMFIQKQKGNLASNDDCFKMALTDAISVAAKALGVGASVHWSADKTKYDSGDWDAADKELMSYAESIDVPPKTVQDAFFQKHKKQYFTATAEELRQTKKEMEKKHAEKQKKQGV